MAMKKAAPKKSDPQPPTPTLKALAKNSPLNPFNVGRAVGKESNKTLRKLSAAAVSAGATLRMKKAVGEVKGKRADSARKTKEAQSMAMDKVKAKKSASADSKRKTAEAKKYPPAKKAPSSAALGLTKKKTAPKKP